MSVEDNIGNEEIIPGCSLDGNGKIDLTDAVADLVRRAGVIDGLVNVQTRHTTTAVLVNENEPLLVEEGYSIFALPESQPVDVAEYTPMVYEGEEDFADVALDWYDEIEVVVFD